MKAVFPLLALMGSAAKLFAQDLDPAQVVPANQTASVTLWKLVESGGWAMIPLGLMSIITVMLVLVFMFTLRRGAVVTEHFMNTADVLLKKRDYAGLLAISNRHGEAAARVVQRTLEFSAHNPTASIDTLREIADTEVATQSSSMNHRVVYLADIAVLAPMVGLLGTVFGIIRSFGALGGQTVATERQTLLAVGVSEALVATASGLLLGIAAMAFFAIFRGRVNTLSADLETAATHVLGLLSLSHAKKREPARTVIDDEF